MYSSVMSGAIFGIQGILIQVEADVSDGLPAFYMVGCLASEIRESCERIRTALRNSGYTLPPKRVVINLSPADIRKDGTGFDLPIAAAILLSTGQLQKEETKDTVFLGELGLDGSVLPVNGVLPIAEMARNSGIRYIVLPIENRQEAALIPGLGVLGISHIEELPRLLRHKEKEAASFFIPQETEKEYRVSADFRELKGQPFLRRAIEVAASGMHHLLMTGPPGAGKTLAARCMAGILPELSYEEQMELTKIYSVRGMLPEQNRLLRMRPFRSPHHTITVSALLGGGQKPRPGEISLAHNGILFLDELPEFSKSVIEALRQPLEEGCVRIGRVRGDVVYPAAVMLVGAMNPCPCGAYPDRNRCRCTQRQIERYQGQVSHAVLDRMDLNIQVRPVSFAAMTGNREEEGTEEVRKRVLRTHGIQKERYQGRSIRFNSQMGKDELEQYCRLGKEEQDYMRTVYEKQKFSGRGYYKLLRVARTLADMEEADSIQLSHLLEAAAYRIPEYKAAEGGYGVGE